MYQEHFKLREAPFSLTPDPDYFYNYTGHQQALNVLLVALQSGEGLIKITGEVGTGKTLLCRKLLAALSGDFQTAYLPNPLLKPFELYQALAEELGVEELLEHLGIGEPLEDALLLVLRQCEPVARGLHRVGEP